MYYRFVDAIQLIQTAMKVARLRLDRAHFEGAGIALETIK
jgi:hypothetical protein